jgi:hypothetical protein
MAMMHRTKPAPDPLLITFLLQTEGGEIHLRCRGCRELDVLSGGGQDEIAGRIEFDGEHIPVVDVGHRLSGAAEIGPSTCLVVVEPNGSNAPMRVGVLVRDLDEVMQLAAGEFSRNSHSLISPNIRLILELCKGWDGPESVEDCGPMHSRLAAVLGRLDEWFLGAAIA